MVEGGQRMGTGAARNSSESRTLGRSTILSSTIERFPAPSTDPHVTTAIFYAASHD
ncbi:predicted protein [Sclerotinia sclerotiorum 1980 UF-70]|uniref:Uncharacterized protein n=1 Tax=Sclerotinia sclerotiorum (strain ATCC 18683 / 1980 / Ss-1) TaxID=665079 RepID=A7EYN9_SCLS1|nr:predicted protein [Sclerotinia sclerotiorum 1980 UF-70]EDN94581.1 predicted protein [Sclerotinia sclerotiorum 1980 UF-70]